jgi:hypothetical protein
LPIFSRQIPSGDGEEFFLVLNETACPLKHTDWWFGVPENDSQKSFSDCQKSVSMEAEPVNAAFLGAEG